MKRMRTFLRKRISTTIIYKFLSRMMTYFWHRMVGATDIIAEINQVKADKRDTHHLTRLGTKSRKTHHQKWTRDWRKKWMRVEWKRREGSLLRRNKRKTTGFNSIILHLAIRLSTDNKVRKGLEMKRRINRIKLKFILSNQIRMEVVEEVKENGKVKVNEETETSGQAWWYLANFFFSLINLLSLIYLNHQNL